MASLIGKNLWYVSEDGCIHIGDPANSVTYHSALNSIIVTTDEPAVKIYDVTSGSVLQKSYLSAVKGEQVKTMYLPEKNKMVFSDRRAIGVRKDLQGVLLLDTALQTPLASEGNKVRLELPLAEASQFLKSLIAADLPCTEAADVIIMELNKKIEAVQEATKGNHKTAKWATVCIEVPYNSLKTVSGTLVAELRRVNVYSQGLSIASAISDRLGYLLPSNNLDTAEGTVDRALMYSEAARRKTFTKWPHNNYKWALPDPMAQAGFYHQPAISGDDRALCFTCNVCLVCWEPTDEPWSEHERHSPSCPYVKGEYTQNVPLSVTYATQPAQKHSPSGDKIECVSNTASEDYVATSTRNGSVVVWNIKHKLKKHCEFVIDPTEIPIALKTGLQVDRQMTPQIIQTANKQEGPMDDSLELTISEGAEGVKDEVDAKYVNPKQGVAVEGSAKSYTFLNDVPFNDAVINDSPFMRPNEDILMNCMCIVEKPEPEHCNSYSGKASCKRSNGTKVKKQPIHPSLVCGVSLRRPKQRPNHDQGLEKQSDIQTDVQLMNKVNENVRGETTPEIIPNGVTDSKCVKHCIEEDFLDTSTSFIPYLLVLSAKKDIKKMSKLPSSGSLRRATSTGNIIPLSNIGMTQPDWTLVDHVYDSDPDLQLVKITPGPSTLSTSSPTESSNKHDEMAKSWPGQSVLVPESAMKNFSAQRAGNVLQCVELPSNLQCEQLVIKSICTTVDRQHLIVLVSPCSSSASAETTTPGATDPSDSTGQSAHDSDSQKEYTKISLECPEIIDNRQSIEEKNCVMKPSLTKSSPTVYGSILIYRFNYDVDTNYACIEEMPIAVQNIDSADNIIDKVFVLPSESCDGVEEELEVPCDEIFLPSTSIGNRMFGLCGQLAVIFQSGKMAILNTSDLMPLACILPPSGDKFVDITYCSGIERLCVCSCQGNLYFYQLSEDRPDQTESIAESMLNVETVFGSDNVRQEEGEEDSPKSKDLLAKQPLTFDSLYQVHNLIQFENLMPRFTATVPPCWTEVQQEQQQRRHPQHLQHQGEANQHTRTWKLQTDNNTWDEHLFEIVLPRVCCVGHVDVRFTVNALCPQTPNIQITLLKQNINAIGKQPKMNDSKFANVDSKINFNIKPTSNSNECDTAGSSEGKPYSVINNVLSPLFLESHNAEILCGPISVSDCLDLSGNGGLVTLTSPQLLLSKPRSFLLHIKGFPSQLAGQQTEKSKMTKPVAPAAADKNSKTIKSLFQGSSLKMITSGSKCKVENLMGCDWLTELSITIRKTKKTIVPKERLQRNAIIELTSFHEKLLSIVCLDDACQLQGISYDYSQNMCLDILTWIANIQMNDPDLRMAGKCLLTTLQPRLKQMILACYIHGGRTTAHKCSRLFSQCMQYSKFLTDLAAVPIFSLGLLEALLNCLPMLPCAYSAGGVKWFFTLLNRVKCLDMVQTSSSCSELLHKVAKSFHERASLYHAMLKARYGLNGHPFEPDLFDMEVPQVVKQVIPGSQPISTFCGTGMVTSTTTSATIPASATSNQQQDDVDFYDFFNCPSEKSANSLLDTAHNYLLGMLEVEPLHFTCHSTSDGTKMERLDALGTFGSVNITNPAGVGTSGLGNTGMSGTINFGVPQSSHTMSSLPTGLSYSLPQSVAAAKHQLQELSSKNYQSVKYKIMHIKQMLNEVNKIIPASIPKTPSSSSELMPCTPKTTPHVMTPPLTPPNEAWQQMFLQSDNQDSTKTSNQIRPSLTVQPPHSLLQPPAPQVLVIERIYSGARRFVILDFGKLVLLTDIIIPVCVDLASLSIDVWAQKEEVDGQRLVVASDIGLRALVMNNIMPPPACRYLKITTIGRYGSGTTRSKIPIGAFYGHSYILPWEWSSKPDPHHSPTCPSTPCQLDLQAQSQLLSLLGSFMSLLEDIQCRYSLARARLGTLLQQVESMQYAFYHTQYYLKKSKNNDEDNNIIQAYKECIQLQLQQNLAMRAIDRLQSAIGIRTLFNEYPTDMVITLKQASTDKLRFILENLMETLISVTNTTSNIIQAPARLFSSLDHQICQDVFKHLCFHGTPRLQVLTSIMLVRVCGPQVWFGEFLGNMLQEFFHSETMQVFSQDRVFILLTAMGQRSLQGPCAVSIMESLLAMLANVLSPIHNNRSAGVMSPKGQLDLTLVGWILLFMCCNLDSSLAIGGYGDDEGATKKAQGCNLASRWNFIAACNMKSHINKSRSVTSYRRNLQKRLYHHKQKLMDIDNIKKHLKAHEQTGSVGQYQGKQFWKELTQFASKHLKDIIQIRKNEAEVLRKIPKDNNRFQDEKEFIDYDQDTMLILPKEKCLPVVHGLMELLLGMDFTCNVDLFLVTCKVLARICISTRPAITLTEALKQEQLEQLLTLVASIEFNHGNISWGGPWAGHAVACLLQDILEGEKVFPSCEFDGRTYDEVSSQMSSESLSINIGATAMDKATNNLNIPVTEGGNITTLTGTSSSDDYVNDQENSVKQITGEVPSYLKDSAMTVDMLLDDDEDDEDDMPDKLHAYITGESIQAPSTSTSSIMPGIEVDDDKYKPDKEGLAVKAIKAVFGSTGYKKPPLVDTKQNQNNNNSNSVTPGFSLSTALDARLELGIETQSELRLRIMLSLQSESLQGAFVSPLPLPPVESCNGTQSRDSPTGDEMLEPGPVITQVTSYNMLTRAFDYLFSQLLQQRINMDSLLHIWLTLNEELPTESNDSQGVFDSTRTPVIPLSVTSVTNLLACVANTPSLTVRTWVLVFQSLTLLANLKLGIEEQRSMVVAMMGDSNLTSIITKFLSGTAICMPSSSYENTTQVGPSAVKSFHLLLQRLRVCIHAEDSIHHLKEIMLKLVYTLTTERGAIHCNLGPMDAQCKFLEFILELSSDSVDINNAISVIDSVSLLVHRHIICEELVYCRSTTDNCVSPRACFGGMFANLLRSTDSGSKYGDFSRDLLMCSLLKLVNKLLQVKIQTRHGWGTSIGPDSHSETQSGSNPGLQEPITDSTKLSQAIATACTLTCPSSFIGQSDEEKAGQASSNMEQMSAQTDEQKTESAHQERTSSESQCINLADIILGRNMIMCNFIQALSYCNSNTMAMILSSSCMPSNMQDSFTGGEPLSVGDGIYQILLTLSRQCNDSRKLMEALFLYLSDGYTPHASQALCRLSEPLLWYILKVLDSAKMMKLFIEKGGVKVICDNFVKCNSHIISTSPSLISTVMQNMSGQNRSDKSKRWETDSSTGIQNFAPLGTIVSCSPTASPADVLVVSTPQHRRARSAPWSYHFYPDEAWVDLKITLPFAVLLKEVQIQPHSPALSTCPAFVSLEASQDGVTTFPLCAPMNTSSLVCIKLQLQRPEVIMSITIRLHRARDSVTIGLSQILLMGHSAFGVLGTKTNNLFLPTEDFVSRSSVGWIRLLHHCLVSQKDFEAHVAERAAPTHGLVNTCCALLVSPISTIYSPIIEAVILKLGFHSGEMGLAVIDNILRGNSSIADIKLSSNYLGKMGGIANESTVEILYQLGTVQDRWTANRLKAMLQWLEDCAHSSLQRNMLYSDNVFQPMPREVSGIPGPAPSHVHCIAAVLWHSNEIGVDYLLSHLVTKDLVSSLYEWSSLLSIDCHLKTAVDYVLCSICHICPNSFTRVMDWMGIVITADFGLTASISDDRKDSSHYHTMMTDDSKEAYGVLRQSVQDTELPISHVSLDDSHLATLALACQSPLATKQLLESGFPTMLAQGLFEFCKQVVSDYTEFWCQPEGASDSHKTIDESVDNDSVPAACLSMTADMVAAVLNFFSEISVRPAIKDWLGGADGNIFWPVLLTMLCNTPLQTSVAIRSVSHKYKWISAEERAIIETAAVRFFYSVISCHFPSQCLFAKVLYDIIKEQGSSSKAGIGVCPLSGFTRRLFLQVLLEDENILVSFRAAPKQYHMHVPVSQGRLQHPQFGGGRQFRTMMVNMHMTIRELINRVSDTPSLAAQLLDHQNGKTSDDTKESTCQIGLDLVDVIENLAIGKKEKSSSGTNNQSASSFKSTQPPRPPTRRSRSTNDPLSKQFNMSMLSLHHKLIANKCLPTEMTLSQLLQVLQQQGLPKGYNALDFVLQLQTFGQEVKPVFVDDTDEITDDILLSSASFPTPLQVFASVGGLALLAEHLPLMYPEIYRQMQSTECMTEAPSVGTTADASQDMVTVDSFPEDFYMLYELPMSPAPQNNRGHHTGNPAIPPHSLVAFGLFLRLPGYAEVLLKEWKKAQCLLRLMLGVTDDGSGGQILSSSLATSLPTLPFIVLKSLFDTTPLTTDDGVLLRRMCLENGALHLILACLSVLSHHSPRVAVPGFQQEAYTVLMAMQTPSPAVTQAPVPTEEKSHQYWAKGTGFGTGSTTSSWDSEQALVRQKSEEEHVTCLLQVLASYINPAGDIPENFNESGYEAASERTLLPDAVPEMLLQSCLVPAMSSYLRNDSVLDMARHVPLYRALLQLLRGLSICPMLVKLLLPLEENGNETAVGKHLEKMRACVDTYASRLKLNRDKITGTKEEEEENEGLAMLIPDIQETAKIVESATNRLKQHDRDLHKDDLEQVAEMAWDMSQEGVDQIYLNEMHKLQFDQYEMMKEEGSTLRFTVHHHYENSIKAAGETKNPIQIRRLAQEAVTLSTSLPLSVSSSVFVRCDAERLDIMKVLITGPEDTPYANGCFEFDVYFPQDYPNAPPYINLETTGNHTVRFNPNLYNDGKVCLSVLNTWHGRPEEKWSAQTSSFLQVLVSIQSLILVCEPYFNEPGYERSRGTPSGTASSREYDANIRQATVKWAILEQLKTPPPSFKDVVQKHFWMKRHKILKQCEEWIAEMETYSNDKRAGRTILHSTHALKRYYNQLREEFAKMKAPEGLENVEVGDIDPKQKQYTTDQTSTSGIDSPKIVSADSNANSVLADTSVAFSSMDFLPSTSESGISSATNC